ncbi:MAG TPA: hypothetical protein PK765_04150 [bacterium]|nr:hypothetical protein [bacterium]
MPQTDYEFIGRVNDQDLNVDLDMDTIVERIRERLPTASLSGTVSEPMDFSTLSAQLDRASENQRRVIAYLNRTLLNFFTKIQSIVPLTAVDPTLADVFSVVLGERDEHVARALVQSQEKRIFLTYGLLHFDGIYARLKREDPDYAIIKIEPYYPFVSE